MDRDSAKRVIENRRGLPFPQGIQYRGRIKVKGEPVVVESYLRPAECAAIIRYYGGTPFANDLATLVENKATLNPLQEGWLHHCANLLVDRRTSPKIVLPSDRIPELFDAALRNSTLPNPTGPPQHYFRRPKIRLQYKAGIDAGTVKLFRASSSSRYNGQIMIVDANRRNLSGYGLLYGRIDGPDLFPMPWSSKTGLYESDYNTLFQAVLEPVIALATNPEQFAESHALEADWCCFCGRKLNDQRSQKAGYGPRCAKRWGLPWGKS